MQRKNSHQGLIGPVLWNLLLRTFGSGLLFATGVILARVLRPEGFGLYGTVLALALMLSSIAQVGLPTLALREVAVSASARDWALLRGVLHWFSRVALASSIAVAALYLAGIWLFEQAAGRDLPSELHYAAPLVPILVLVSLLFAELRGLHRYMTGQLLDMFVRPTVYLIALGIAYFGLASLDADFALLLQIPAGIVTVAAGYYWVRRALPGEVWQIAPVRRPRAWLLAAAPLAATDILLQLNAVYGLLIVSAIWPTAEAGYLRVALSAILFIAMPLSVLNIILVPRLAPLHADQRNAEIQVLMSGASVVMFAFTLAALGGLLLVGRPLLEAFFGEAYGHAWLPLILLTAAQLITAFFGVGSVFLSVSGAERKLAQSYLISTPAAILAAILLVPSMGAVGAAWAAVAGSLVQNIICWRFLRSVGLECSLLGILQSRHVHPFAGGLSSLFRTSETEQEDRDSPTID